MADTPNPANSPRAGTPLPPKPALSAPQAPKVVLPAPPPGSAPSLRPPAPAAPPITIRPAPSAAAAPTVATFVETNYSMVDSPKERAPLVVLDFLAMAASLALTVLLWNDYLTLLTQPLFNR